jgi:O-antigen ligase
MDRYLQVAAWCLLAFAVSFGPPVQYGAAVFAASFFLTLIFRHGWRVLSRETVPHLFWAGAFLGWLALRAVVSPDSFTFSQFVEYFVGYLPWLLLPWLGVFSTDFVDKRYTLVWRALVAGLACMAAACLIQYFFSYRLDGLLLVPSDSRAQGLVSHPLTLAYAMLVVWPWALEWVFSSPHRPLGWLMFSANVVGLWTSESRTVQIVALGLLIFYGLRYFRGRMKFLIPAVLLALIVVGGLTENRLVVKYWKTAQLQVDRLSDYPDDRLAIWHANGRMAIEQPLVGYGPFVSKDRLNKQYEEIGLGQFQKKYWAHNQFLQIILDGGLVALFLFLGWIESIARLAWRDRLTKPYARATLGMLAVFLLAGFTQNAFHDLEVRFALTFCVMMFFALRATKQRSLDP